MWSTTFPTRAKQGWIALCSWLGRSLSMDLSSCEPLLHSKDRPVALEAFKAKCPPPQFPPPYACNDASASSTSGLHPSTPQARVLVARKTVRDRTLVVRTVSISQRHPGLLRHTLQRGRVTHPDSLDLQTPTEAIPPGPCSVKVQFPRC